MPSLDLTLTLQALTLVLGFYMAWNIGANDVSNAMGTSVGSKALTLKRAVILAAILEFAGAFLLGGNVSETIQKGILNTTYFVQDPNTLALGMIGALLSTGAALQIASYFALPISTTHAIVGAVLGFGVFIGGIGAVHWGHIGYIASSWIFSPILSGVISFSLFHVIQRKVLYALDPFAAAKKMLPSFVFLCIFVVSLSLFPSTLIALCIATLLAGASHFSLKAQMEPALIEAAFSPHARVSLEKAAHHLQRAHLARPESEEISSLLSSLTKLTQEAQSQTSFAHTTRDYQNVENLFISLQILSACLVAFAHGANDVANAIGPVAATLELLKTGALKEAAHIPPWLLFFGGSGIVIGLATWGWRVIETVGKKITELTPTRGFAAELGAAITILIASKLGMPISTTHALIGAVFGVGLARGLQALNVQTLKEIIVSWLITIPFCAALSILSFYLLKSLF